MKPSLKYTGLLLICLVFLTSCSSITNLKANIFGREPINPPEPLVEVVNKFEVKKTWQYTVGASGNFELSPKVAGGSVFAVGNEGELVRLEETSGKLQWKVNVGEPVSGGVGAGGGLVLVGTQGGTLYAYDFDGKQQWKSQLSSEILSAPEYFDGLVIVRTGDSKIYGVDAVDGHRVWVYDRTGPALTIRSSAGVVVDGGAVYAGFAGGKLIALRADNGKLLWDTVVAQPKGSTEIERISDITSLPVIDGPVVYAVAYQGRVAAIDRRSGRVIWNREISSLNGINVQDRRIYLAHATGSVYSLDDEKGKSFWRQGGLINRQLTTPLPMDGVIALGDVEGYVHFLSIENGAIESRLRLGESPLMPKMSTIDQTTLVAQSRAGIVYAVKIK